MSKEKQIDIIRDLLTEFDEMGFIPTTTVPGPDAYAIEWKKKLTEALQGYCQQSEGERVNKSEDRVEFYEYTYQCSLCGYCMIICAEEDVNFCPNCGASMKGGAE